MDRFMLKIEVPRRHISGGGRNQPPWQCVVKPNQRKPKAINSSREAPSRDLTAPKPSLARDIARRRRRHLARCMLRWGHGRLSVTLRSVRRRLAEQAEQGLALITSNPDTQGRELTLNRLGRLYGRLACQVGIDNVAKAFLGRIRDLRDDLGLLLQLPLIRAKRAKRVVDRRLEGLKFGRQDGRRIARGCALQGRQRIVYRPLSAHRHRVAILIGDGVQIGCSGLNKVLTVKRTVADEITRLAQQLVQVILQQCLGRIGVARVRQFDQFGLDVGGQVRQRRRSGKRHLGRALGIVKALVQSREGADFTAQRLSDCEI